MSHEGVLIVPFRQENKEKTSRIGTIEFEDVFPWGPKDMPGIVPTIAVQKLYVDPTFSPIKQKKRLFNYQKNLAIREEVQTLLKAHATRELKFPAWIANVELNKRPNNKWRICTDFTSLNKACPKNFYLLPCLGRLVDGNEEKIVFITEYGLYCWRFMPFRLKNAGATYHRMVNSIFTSQIGHNMEIFVDDMLVKSKTRADNLDNLRKTFDRLMESRLKINPEKCSFGVVSFDKRERHGSQLR
ncbi:hypothetical protein LIER_29503 [Lithospermum erythrorhizon]|uniref:Reverse transcriptase domain-containing protein n=1 Tax=Lithospermum erythrorhizon TaxID=34254 RepID=A0AAV3RKY5_LITER